MHLWAGNNATTAGGEKRQQQGTSWRGSADRYRGPSYDAYHNDAMLHQSGQQQQQQQHASQLWYPATTNNHASPASSSSSSSSSTTSAAAPESAGSRRALHDQRPRLRRSVDDSNDDDVRFFVAFTFILELLVIVGLALLEYFLRFVLLVLTPSTPAGPSCCCSKGPTPYWSNPPFLIFDIRALWRSVLSARAPECKNLKVLG